MQKQGWDNDYETIQNETHRNLFRGSDGILSNVRRCTGRYFTESCATGRGDYRGIVDFISVFIEATPRGV